MADDAINHGTEATGRARGLPIDARRLIEGRGGEDDAVAYMEHWDPEQALHTVCAFANDLDNRGGGHIVVGAAEVGNRIEVSGLTEEEASRLERELEEACGLIEPEYAPVLSFERAGGHTVAVIWAPSSAERPFRCPTSLGGDPEDTGCYIRRGHVTVRGGEDEERMILEMEPATWYDDSACRQGEESDILRYRVDDYLRRVSSPLADSGMPSPELYRTMRLVRERDGRPLRASLMMFSDRPEEHFPYSRTEVVVFRDPCGSLFEEAIFDGPVDIQIVSALECLRNSVIRERVVKPMSDDGPRAIRFFSYPLDAVREVLVNALYHRSYDIPEPVKVYVYRDRIEITSLPGPDPEIPDEDVRGLRMRGAGARNKRLGCYLRELGLAECRNTGMGTIAWAMERNGSPPPVFQTDARRSYLRVVLPIHPGFSEPVLRYRQYGASSVMQSHIPCTNEVPT